MNFVTPKIFSLVLITACWMASAAHAQDPVDQQVSPEVKRLKAAGAKEDARSRQEPATSPEVRNVEAAGAKEDASAWHNLEAFIQQKTKEGLHGKALGDAVKAERERLGLTGLSKRMVKKMREFELNQDKVEKIETRITMMKANLGANTVGDSKTRSLIEQKIKKNEEEKKVLEKRSADILADLNSNAKF